MTTPNPTPSSTEPAIDPLARLQATLDKARAGDRTVLPLLSQILDQDEQLWQRAGNVAAQAEADLIRVAAGKNLFLGEAIARKQAAFKVELVGGSADPVIRALAERVAICALQVAYFDGLIPQNEGKDVARLKPLQALLDAANRRYLNSLRALATVQKLLRPTLAPIAVASRLEGRRSVRREAEVAAGVGVEN